MRVTVALPNELLYAYTVRNPKALCVPSAGYELDEGMHGPNYGYIYNHAVVMLSDGGRDFGKTGVHAKMNSYFQSHN